MSAPLARAATLPLDFTPAGHLYATHQLHSYAARCPPPLVDWALTRFSAPGEVVLDPMVGSGTTLVEAALLKRRAWGIDIDPLARLIAKVKATPIEPARIATARQLLERLVRASSVDCTWRPELPDLSKWFREDVCEDLARLRDSIQRVSDGDKDVSDLLWIAFSSLIVARTSVANARDLVHSRHHSRVWQENPDAIGRFLLRLRQMERAMTDYVSRLDGHVPEVRLVGCDARSTGLADASVDSIFTSPPYVSALDYVRAHIFAVAWMADVLGAGTEEYRQLGRAYIGTERAALRDGGRESVPPPMGVPRIDELVRRLHPDHPKNAWIVWRYFSDMSQVFQEVGRLLREGGRAIFVVCPSNIRKVRVPTHELFVDLAERALPTERRLVPEEVLERTIHDRRRVMPYLETAFGPRMRTEYVLVFRRREN